MARGTPLDDADRWPWLDAIAGWIRAETAAGRSGVGAVAAGLGGALGLALAGALGRRDRLGERLERRRALLLDLEERVLLEHLLDFLVQLERGQLQQPDRLLQLRRQREVLRQPEL